MRAIGRQKGIVIIPYILTIVLTILALRQLVTFDAFVQTIVGYHIGTVLTSQLFAVAMVVAEVFSIPFLLHLASNRLGHALSAACVLLVPVAWIGLGLLMIVQPHGPKGSGVAMIIEGLLLFALAARSLMVLSFA